MEATVMIPLDEIRALVLRALIDNGLDTGQAEVIADVVTRAGADACRSHGLYRLAGYVAAMRAGRVNANARPQVHQRTPSVIYVDGDGGFAPVAAARGRARLSPPHVATASR